MIPYFQQAPVAAWDPAFAVGVALHGALLLAALVVVLDGCVRGALRRLDVGVVAVGLVALSVGVFGEVPSSAIPVGWITVLQEGLEAQNIASIYGRGVHAGSGFRFLVVALADGPGVTIRDVVRMNLWLTGVELILFFGIARHVLARGWTAALFTVAFGANLLTFHAALSELASPATGAYVLVAFAVMGARARVEPAPRWVRGAAVLALALATACAAAVRVELALPGGVALALVVIGEARWRRGLERALALARTVPTWSTPKKALGLLAVVVVPLLFHGVTSHSGWVVEALHPLHLSFLTLPIHLILFWIPWSVVVLLVFGLVHGFRRFHAFLGLPLTLLLLYKLYYSASHIAFYEVLRYTTYVLPGLLVMALFGWREVERWIERLGGGEAARRAAAIGLGLLCFVPPTTGLREQLHYGDFERDVHLHQVLLTRNTQIEVRTLVHELDEHPECVFVARTTAQDPPPPGPILDYQRVVFGGPIGADLAFPDDGRPLSELVRELAPDAPCAFAYRGLDCNLTTSDGCVDFVAGLRRVFVRRFGARPYNDVPERRETGPEVALELYAIPLDRD